MKDQRPPLNSVWTMLPGSPSLSFEVIGHASDGHQWQRESLDKSDKRWTTMTVAELARCAFRLVKRDCLDCGWPTECADGACKPNGCESVFITRAEAARRAAGIECLAHRLGIRLDDDPNAEDDEDRSHG